VVIFSLALFAASAAIEGAITSCVIQAIEKRNTAWVQKRRASNRRTLTVISRPAIALGAVGLPAARRRPTEFSGWGFRWA
jgi:hypothetical protein